MSKSIVGNSRRRKGIASVGVPGREVRRISNMPAPTLLRLRQRPAFLSCGVELAAKWLCSATEVLRDS